jgi:hypothetical protein
VEDAMIDRRFLALVAALALLAAAVPCDAGPRLADVRGHLFLGYSKLFGVTAPGGSLSIGAGVEHPVRGRLRAGVDVGSHLLGSRTLKQGSLSTGVDYSVVEALALVHWSPGGGGSWVTLSGGPGLFMARANLGSSAVGASFSHEAVAQTRPGLALGVTASPHSEAPVTMGLQAALRVIPLESGTWTIATARVAILY